MSKQNRRWRHNRYSPWENKHLDIKPRAQGCSTLAQLREDQRKECHAICSKHGDAPLSRLIVVGKKLKGRSYRIFCTLMIADLEATNGKL